MKKRVTCESFLEFQFISDPQMSPDQVHTAFLIKEADIKANAYKSSLYLYNHPTGKTKKMSGISNVAAYAWEDAETIIFPGLRSEKAKKDGMGYYRLNIHGGEAEEVFTLPVKGGRAVPVGNGKYAVTASYNNDEAHKGYEHIKEVPFLVNGGEYTSRKRGRLYLYDSKTAELRPVTEPMFNVVGIKVDAGRVLYVGQEFKDVKSLKNGVYVYDVAKEESTCLLEPENYLVKGFELYKDRAVLNLTDGASYGNGENGDFYTIDIETKELYDYHYPHDVNCSPDGKYIGFLMTHMDREKDGYTHDLHIMDSETGKIRQITRSGDITAFSWENPEEILFASRRGDPKPGTADFYRISICGGEAQKVLTIPKACGLPIKLADGKWLITVKNPTDPKEKREDRAQEGVDYWTFTDKPFIRNGEKLGERRRLAIEVYDEKKDTLTPVTSKYYETAGYDVSEDRSKIVYFGEDYEDCASQFKSLWEYDLETGEHKELIEEGKYQISLAKYIGRDKILIQASDLKRSATQNHDIFIWGREREDLQMIASPDGMYTTLIDVDAVYGGGRGTKVADGKLIGARLRKTMTAFEELDSDSGKIREIALVDAFTSFDIAGGQMYAVALLDYRLAEIYKIDMASGAKEKMTAFSEEYLTGHEISVPEKFTFTASNGEEVDGFVIPPVGMEEGKKYPAVLFIHGGPKWAYGHMFTHVKQCFASKGMYVIYCNPHGGDGYGEKFLEMIEQWGNVDYDHLMEFTDECIKRYPGIDEERLGVTGGSYGGYMTNWIIGHTDRFKAAVSQRGISNLISTTMIIDLGDRIMKQTSGDKTPWTDEAVLWEHSPLKHVKNAVTPTLFLHSDMDYRCYMGDTFQMFTALKQIGVDTEMYVFHGENHGLSRSGKPSNRVVRVDAMIQWMETYL